MILLYPLVVLLVCIIVYLTVTTAVDWLIDRPRRAYARHHFLQTERFRRGF